MRERLALTERAFFCEKRNQRYCLRLGKGGRIVEVALAVLKFSFTDPASQKLLIHDKIPIVNTNLSPTLFTVFTLN